MFVLLGWISVQDVRFLELGILKPLLGGITDDG